MIQRTSATVPLRLFDCLGFPEMVGFVAVCPDTDFLVVGDLRGLESPLVEEMAG